MLSKIFYLANDFSSLSMLDVACLGAHLYSLYLCIQTSDALLSSRLGGRSVCKMQAYSTKPSNFFKLLSLDGNAASIVLRDAMLVLFGGEGRGFNSHLEQ